MGKVGFYLGENAGNDWLQIVLDLQTIDSSVCVLMEGAFKLTHAIPKPCLIIGRPYSLMVGFKLLLNGPLAYDQGREMAEKVLRVYGHIGVNAWILQNEPTIKEREEAWCWGAFDAGAAGVFGEAGKTYIGGNFAMGTPEPGIFARYWQDFLNFGGAPGSILGIHGYTDGETHPHWLERRPWELWKPELDRLGLPMPRIIFTEAGFDNGHGYQGRWTSERYANYLEDLPTLEPEAEGFAIFLYGGTDDWIEKGFDIQGDSVVLAGMARAKKGEVIPMAEWDRERIWEGYQRRLSLVPMFEKVRAANPRLGDWIDGNEYDVAGFRLRGAAGGLVYARIGDWANTCIAWADGGASQLPLV